MGNITSSRTLPPAPSDIEAKYYYVGLPSSPILVARTSATPWEVPPAGFEEYYKRKELHPIGSHPLQAIWEDNLALKLHILLDSMEVTWTSTDVVRIGHVGDSSPPALLWIGVVPGSLSRDNGAIVASKCQELLVNSNISDVDVEIRESIVTRSVGPQLLPSILSFEPTVDIRNPLTTTLGLPISPESTPHAEGMGGFFITDGDNGRLLLITARHVVLPSTTKKNNTPVSCKIGPLRNVRLFGP